MLKYHDFDLILLIKPESITKNRPTKYIVKIGSSKNRIKKNAANIGVINRYGATFDASKIWSPFIQNRYEIPFINAPLIKILIQSFPDGIINVEYELTVIIEYNIAEKK